DGDDGDGD
nr:RecName: Full=Uncharacterized protein SMPP2 [Nautilus macromphalus]